MKTEFKPKRFEVGLSGSGWGVWDITTDCKVEGFSKSKQGRLEALELMYELNGWKKPTSFN